MQYFYNVIYIKNSEFGFPYLQAASLLQLTKPSNRKPPTIQKGFTITPIIIGRYYASSAASKKTREDEKKQNIGKPDNVYFVLFHLPNSNLLTIEKEKSNPPCQQTRTDYSTHANI